MKGCDMIGSEPRIRIRIYFVVPDRNPHFTLLFRILIWPANGSVVLEALIDYVLQVPSIDDFQLCVWYYFTI
jgi:hypothetical protein